MYNIRHYFLIMNFTDNSGRQFLTNNTRKCQTPPQWKYRVPPSVEIKSEPPQWKLRANPLSGNIDQFCC
jgi:hypothetical protein